MKVKTNYWPKPIPLRCFDWTAVDDDTYDGPGSPCGCGATEQDAIDDLLSKLDEADDLEHRLGIDDAEFGTEEWRQQEEANYERAAEDAQRKRDAREGFDD